MEESPEKKQKVEDQANVQVAEPQFPRYKGATNDRMKAVKGAMQHAWKGYKQFAWGHDHLKPISKSYSEWMNCGLTIIDSLDTLYLMGMDEGWNKIQYAYFSRI